LNTTGGTGAGDSAFLEGGDDAFWPEAEGCWSAGAATGDTFVLMEAFDSASTDGANVAL
jgi:hypothetical protein